MNPRIPHSRAGLPKCFGSLIQVRLEGHCTAAWVRIALEAVLHASDSELHRNYSVCADLRAHILGAVSRHLGILAASWKIVYNFHVARSFLVNEEATDEVS